MGLACLGASCLTFSPNQTIELAFSVLTPVAGLGAINNHEPSPPAGRFIGKSPEYVSVYTDAYKSKALSLRTKSAAAGTATGYGVLIRGCLMLIAE